MKIERIPFVSLPHVLGESRIPQFNSRTVEAYFKLDGMFRGQDALLYDGAPVFSPTYFHNSYSWYWNDLCAVPVVNVTQDELPKLWSYCIDAVEGSAFVSEAVMSKNPESDMGPFAYPLPEHYIDLRKVRERGLDAYNAKRRYNLRRAHSAWSIDGWEVREVGAGSVYLGEVFDQILLAQTRKWKARLNTASLFEYALRQWFWAKAVVDTGRGKLLVCFDANKKVRGALTHFQTVGKDWEFGAFMSLDDQPYFGTYLLMESLKLLPGEGRLYLGTSGAHLSEEASVWWHYKRTCATDIIMMPTFAAKTPSSTLSLWPPFLVKNTPEQNAWVLTGDY